MSAVLCLAILFPLLLALLLPAARGRATAAALTPWAPVLAPLPALALAVAGTPGLGLDLP